MRERELVAQGQGTALTVGALLELVNAYGDVYLAATGTGFPQDPKEQLFAAVAAVFDSWNAPRAQVYREQCGISNEAGTAANVMQMVFGNRDAHSATGVCFSRDPATGQPGLYGEFLFSAQGEDIVAGTETPEPVARMRQVLPEAYDELEAAVAKLETHYRDVQDVEFTVESGRLYILQTRSAKRTATAALRAAVDMTAEGLLTRADAIQRVDAANSSSFCIRQSTLMRNSSPIATGLSASPGAASASPSSTPTRPPRGAQTRASCSSGPRRRRTTSTACSRRKASSLRGAG